MRERSWAGTGALLAAAATLLLHAPGLSWGLPSQYGWAPDELIPEVVLDGLAQGFSGGWASKYPPFHQALLGTLYRPVLWWHGLGPAQAVPGGAYHALFLIGRVVSLLMAAGVVALVYDCGRLLLDRRAAGFAALLTATMLPFGYYARLANLDVPYLFWALVSLRFALRALDRPGALDLAAFGVAGVLAIATKDQAYGLYALGAPLLVFARARRRAGAGGLVRELLGRDVALAALASGAAFVAAFRLVGNWEGFVEHVRIITGPASEDFQLFPATLAGQAALAWHSAAQLAFVLGPAAAAVCALGLACVGGRRLGLLAPPPSGATGRPAVLLGLLAAALAYYATFVAVVLYSYDRFLLPVGVILSFFGGAALAEATARPGWPGRLGRLVALAIAAYGVARCASLGALMRNDTRYAAERWLGAHVEPGQHVAGVGPLPRLPRLDGMRWSQLPPSAAPLAEARPEWVVMNSDTARAMRPGGAKARFYEQLRSGALGYRQAYADRWRAPWLVFDPERLSRGAYGPVLSNLEVVNPGIEVYRRASP
jgi:hypothetical protein